MDAAISLPDPAALEALHEAHLLEVDAIQHLLAAFELFERRLPTPQRANLQRRPAFDVESVFGSEARRFADG